MSVTTASPDLHRIDEMTIALCRAAREASVEIPRSYAQRLVATSEGAGELGVSRLGVGVVIHTAPPTKRRLPVIIGYADSRGQWYQDGSRHVEVHESDEPMEGKQVES